MTIVRRPSPFGELLSLRQAMDRLFDDDFGPRAGWTTVTSAGGALPLDVTTTDDALIVEAALPGVDPDAVDINVADGTLTISARSASSASTEENSYILREIRRGTVSRSMTLPNGLEPDKASATFQNGILELRIPKAEQEKPRQIKISPVSSGQANPAVEASASGGNGSGS